MVIHPGQLGRRTPPDFPHILKYPFKAVMKAEPLVVNKALPLPYWHWQHNQGKEGACVGFGLSMMMSILNEQQAKAKNFKPYEHRYNARWLWNEAKKIDQWDDTQPGDDNGTSVSAGCDVLRTLGHVRIIRRVDRPADISEGILANRWARTVDEMRAAIAKGLPIAFGTNWYGNFDTPEKVGNKFWIGRGQELGVLRGGHCYTIYGASDKLQAFYIKNSWGKDYPLVLLPYKTAERLLDEDGESCIITDR